MFTMLVILTILKVLAILLLICSVIGMVLIAVDFLHYTYQEHRTEKKREQTKGRHHKTDFENMVVELKYFIFEMRFVELREAAKAELRRTKEASAEGGFFEEPYTRGFDTTGELAYRGEHRYPTLETETLVKLLDDRADDTIFENTEDI